MRKKTVKPFSSLKGGRLRRKSTNIVKLDHFALAFLSLFGVGLILSALLLSFDSDKENDFLEKNFFRISRDEAKYGPTVNDITPTHMDDLVGIKKHPIDITIDTREDGDQNKDTAMNVDKSEMEIKEQKHYITVIKDATINNVEQQVQTQSLRGGDGNHTFYSFLQSRKCLPSQVCLKCLSIGKSCLECNNCGCFCEHLCQRESSGNAQKLFTYLSSPEMDLGQDYSIEDNGKRFIPKIVHQTWKEDVTLELYPIKSMFQNSWKQKGWEYRFYTDDDAIKFIKRHFPQEVLEAYNTLIPTAYKADLFRYCVLFIYGGVYADFDVLCETDLDQVIDPEVAFTVPVDLGERCLWNGFIGSAPGHPFIALAIMTVVNYVRNRYTSIDLMNSLCHKGKVDKYDTEHEDLYLSGPCLLGHVINKALGRPPQSKYHAHESFDLWLKGIGIPGHFELLEFRRFLGGVHIVLPSKNLIVAGTGLANSKDAVEKKSPGNHYSNLTRKNEGRIFGTLDVYQDMVSINEDVHLVRNRNPKQE